MHLFQKKKESAVVFVDYEYMQISFKNRYGINPPVSDWYEEICEHYDVKNIYFFADFTNHAIKSNLNEIRKITSNTIDTQNTASHHKKDFTDFFILDYIYQAAFERQSPGTFIIFTGDGHFGAVTRFLTTKCGKKVIVYGIERTISGQLKSLATACVEYPTYEKLKKLYYPVFAKHMQQMLQSYQYLTFMIVIKYVFEQTQINQTVLRDALEEMISDGYISMKETYYRRRKTRILSPNWDKLKRERIL